MWHLPPQSPLMSYEQYEDRDAEKYLSFFFWRECIGQPPHTIIPNLGGVNTAALIPATDSIPIHSFHYIVTKK